MASNDPLRYQEPLLNLDNFLSYERPTTPDPTSDQAAIGASRGPLDHEQVPKAYESLQHASLTILDMPTEILVQIIEWLQLGDEESASDSFQNCRLTCRRLSHIADEFLIATGTLRLSLDNESLARLESISRHPTIRNTIKTVELDLALYPDTEGHLASYFPRHTMWLLELALGKYDAASKAFADQEHWPEVDASVIPRIHSDVGRIYEACSSLQPKYHRPVPDVPDEWPEMEHVVAALVKQTKMYDELFHEQQSLLQDEFLLRLVTAFSQLSHLGAIRFTEWDFNRVESAIGGTAPLAFWKKWWNKGTVRFPFEAFSKNPDQAAIDILVRSKFLLKALPMMRISRGPHCLFSFMTRLTDSLTTSNLSHVVKNLEIGVWGTGIKATSKHSFQYRSRGFASTNLTFGYEADPTSPAYVEDQRQIRLATRHLESFSLNTVCNNHNTVNCSCAQTRMTMLLSPFLQTPELRKLNIHHSGQASGYPSQQHHENTGGPLRLGPRPCFHRYRGYVSRGLATRVSPLLCDITLRGVALHQRDFERFLQHGLERPLHQLRLEDIELQTGTWLSMLVFLRRLKCSSTPKSLLDISGAELRGLRRLSVAARLHPPACGNISDFINGRNDDVPNPIDRLGLGSAIYANLRVSDEALWAKEEREAEPHDACHR